MLGEKWTLLIIRALLDVPARYVALLHQKVPSIASAALQTRLATMEADGLITKRRYREQPPRVMYELTDDGRAATRVLEALAEWEQSRALETA